MNFCKSVVLVWLGVGCAAAACGQAGVYIGYTGTRLSGIECATSSAGPCGSGSQPGTNGSVNPSGVQFGGYYNFKTVGPVLLGLDLRGGDFHSNKSATSSGGGKNATGLDDVLLGVKGTFHTKYSWLNPYVQISAGYARSNATEQPFGTPNALPQQTLQPRAEDNFAMYEALAGVDVRIFPVLDLRPVEVGIGNMNRFGNGTGSGSVGVKTIGAAFVFHLPSK